MLLGQYLRRNDIMVPYTVWYDNISKDKKSILTIYLLDVSSDKFDLYFFMSLVKQLK